MRYVFIQQYDIEYVRDLYSHSQWALPKNVRSIGDDGVFQAAADRYITTGNIFAINAETPPVGKYLYALSLIVFGTPYLLLPLIYLITLFSFAAVLYDVNKTKAIILAVMLFSLEPIIGMQVGMTLLDLPQLAILLLHILALFHLGRATTNKAAILYAIAVGVTLGLFAATKFGLMALALIVADCWFLLVSRKTKKIPFVLFITLLAYIAASLPYFFIGNSLIQWFKLELWRINFFIDAKMPFLPGSIFLTLLAPIHVTWWQSTPNLIREWTLFWPLIPITLIIYAKQNILQIWSSTVDRLKEVLGLKAKELKWYETENVEKYMLSKRVSYLWLLTVLLIILNALIPFWPRYLTLVIPLAIIIFTVGVNWTFLTSKIPGPAKYFVITLFLSLQIALMINATRPSVGESAARVAENIQKQTYQDLYNSIANKQELDESRIELWRRLVTLEQILQVREKTVSIQPVYVYPWQNTVTLELTSRSTTPFGTFTHTSPITFQRAANKWLIQWQDSLVIPEYQKGDVISVEEQPFAGGTIKDQDGNTLSEFSRAPVIFVMPRNVRDANTVISEISHVTGITEVDVHGMLYANHPFDLFAYVGPPKHHAPAAILEQLSQRPGVRISQQPRRTFSVNLTEQQLAQVKQFVLANPEVEPVRGATIVLNKKSGEPLVIYQSQSIGGQDLTLEL